MIKITCDRCGVDLTQEMALKISILNKAKDRASLDHVGWILSMAVLFNIRLKTPFLFCKKCLGFRRLGELKHKNLIDFGQLQLYQQMKDSEAN